MTDKLIYLIISIVVFTLLLLCWQYILAVYEVKFQVSETQLFADNESETTIIAVPINAMGFKAPFRKTEISYKFETGSDLVETENNSEEGIIKLKAKNETGTVVLFIKSDYSLMPTKIEIIINSNFT
ncbi:MAG: hypothetical protein ACEPO8_04665 [Rhodothermaceae bacterium]